MHDTAEEGITMRRFALPLLGVGLFAASLTPVHAQTTHSGTHTPVRTVLKLFRLGVAATPAPGTTFWVAYGPLGGRFGIVRLRASTSTSYVAALRLPALGKTTFSYLAGHGTIHA